MRYFFDDERDVLVYPLLPFVPDVATQDARPLPASCRNVDLDDNVLRLAGNICARDAEAEVLADE